MPNESEIDEMILEEGCYYLSEMGLSHSEIAHRFETTEAKVRKLVEAHGRKLKSGKVRPSEFDRTFWEDVKKEAEGDVKVTFVSEKGFHHAWKSELRKLDGSALMSIFEASKDFLGTDQNQKFLDYPAPKGYDPLVLDREVRKAVGIVSELLDEKWKQEKSEKAGSNKANPTT